jgi:hypothetical protein
VRHAAPDDIVRRQPGDVLPAQHNAAGLGLDHAGECAQRGAFAGTIRPDQRHQRPLWHAERNRVQHLHFAIAGDEVLDL